MPRFVVAHRKPPLARLAAAAAGVLALGFVWRLAAGEPAAAAANVEAQATAPADYVPEDGPAALSQPIDPLGPTDDSARPTGPAAPLDFMRVTSGYGLRRHPILGFSRMHQGVDLAAREGAPVLAAADGIVTQAGPLGDYGNMLRLRHADGWATGYAHLSAFAPGIAPGVDVTRGEVVGFVGHTGLATGPHLHYEVSRFGVKVDPMRTPFGGAPAADPHAGAYAVGGLRGALASDTPPG